MDVYEAARTSISLPLPLDAPAISMFRMVDAEARSLIRQRDEFEILADELLRQVPYSVGALTLRWPNTHWRSCSSR